MRNKYEWLLAGVISARATSYIFNKMILADLEPFNLLAIRFFIAFVLLLLLFRKRVAKMDASSFKAGVLVGTGFFCVMSCELHAARASDTSILALLENCSVVFVPLFECILTKRLPARMTVFSTLLALTGIFCLKFHVGNFTIEMLLALLAAVFYSMTILLTARVTRKALDTLCVGIVQVGTIAMLALGASLLTENIRLPARENEWLMLALLSIVCTGFGFTLQPVAQRHVSVERAGLFCALSPAVATMLGIFILGEKTDLFGILGIVLILSAILLPGLIRLRSAKKDAN